MSNSEQTAESNSVWKYTFDANESELWIVYFRGSSHRLYQCGWFKTEEEASELCDMLNKAWHDRVAAAPLLKLMFDRWLDGHTDHDTPDVIARVVALSTEDRVKVLEAAIRQHRDERGDDRCHADDGRLYAVLPEGDTRPAAETAVTLENCQKYIECRQTGREYISPQRRIEELEAENARLKQIIANMEENL